LFAKSKPLSQGLKMLSRGLWISCSLDRCLTSDVLQVPKDMLNFPGSYIVVPAVLSLHWKHKMEDIKAKTLKTVK